MNLNEEMSDLGIREGNDVCGRGLFLCPSCMI